MKILLQMIFLLLQFFEICSENFSMPLIFPRKFHKRREINRSEYLHSCRVLAFFPLPWKFYDFKPSDFQKYVVHVKRKNPIQSFVSSDSYIDTFLLCASSISVKKFAYIILRWIFKLKFYSKIRLCIIDLPGSVLRIFRLKSKKSDVI